MSVESKLSLGHKDVGWDEAEAWSFDYTWDMAAWRVQEAEDEEHRGTLVSDQSMDVGVNGMISHCE